MALDDKTAAGAVSPPGGTRARPGSQRRWRHLLAPVLALSVASALVAVGPQAATPAAAVPPPPWRIMLVGDSITSGQTLATVQQPPVAVDRSGQWPTYRGPLWAKLTGGPGADGQIGVKYDHSVNFVGSQNGVGSEDVKCESTNPSRQLNVLGVTLDCDYANKIGGGVQYPLVDPHHEGHDGWTIDEMRDQLPVWMAAHKPDIVVLLAGANDIGDGDAPPNMVQEVGQAINRMRAANPNVRVVVPQLPPHHDHVGRTTTIIEYNALLPAFVAQKSTAASKVITADLFSGYCAAGHPGTSSPWDTHNPAGECSGVHFNNDGSHPNQMGGQLIAQRMGDAMEAAGFFDPLPSPPPPPPPPSPPPPTPPANPGSGGYFLVEQDGDLYAFGTARAKLKVIDPAAVDNPSRGVTVSGIVKPRLGGAQALKVESTLDGKGLWVLLSNGAIVNLGNARAAKGVSPAALTKVVAGQPERPAALARLGSGDLWVFTTAGRIVPQFGPLPAGAKAAMDQVLAANLVGPILDAKPTGNGTGAYATGSDGGVFAYDAPFRGSVPGALARIGRTVPDQPVVGVTVDPDGTGYWLVARDGGVFAFAAPFRGALPALVPFPALVSPVNGMVPFGSGYLLVAGDGGVFTFSDLPFSGSAAGLVDSAVVGITPT